MGRLLFIPDGGVKAGDDRVEKRDVEFLVEVEELLRLKLRRVRRRCHRQGGIGRRMRKKTRQGRGGLGDGRDVRGEEEEEEAESRRGSGRREEGESGEVEEEEKPGSHERVVWRNVLVAGRLQNLSTNACTESVFLVVFATL